MYRDGRGRRRYELVHFCVVPESEFQHQRPPDNRKPCYWSGKVLFNQHGSRCTGKNNGRMPNFESLNVARVS